MFFSKKKLRKFKKLRFKNMPKPKAGYQKEVVAISLAAVFSFLAVSFYSYNAQDNTLLHWAPSQTEVSNWAGAVGANVAAMLLYLIGSAVYVLLAALILPTYFLLFTDHAKQRPLRYRFLPVLVITSAALCHGYGFDITGSFPGGLLGQGICVGLVKPFGIGGASIILWTLLWVSMVMLSRRSLLLLVVRGLKAAALYGYDALCWHARAAVKMLRVFWCWCGYGVGKLQQYRAARLEKKQEMVNVDEEQQVGHAEPTVTNIAPEISFWNDVDRASTTPERSRDVGLQDEPIELLGEDFLEKEVLTLQQVADRNKKVLYENGKAIHRPITGLPNTVVSKNFFAVQPDAEKTSYQTVKQALELLRRERRISCSFTLPGTSLFMQRQTSDHKEQVKRAAQKRAKKLEEKLQHFGVKGSITGIHPGPLITMFEYQPEIDSKISKITSLEDDLAMALSAVSIRIIAPIPGRNAVGFEIANRVREDVYFSDVMKSKSFKEGSAALPLILGVDVVGVPMVQDLVKMPHLLIGGTTGSGKSVGMNAMLTSLLCRRTPEQLRLILIDPKRLEFTPYADIPHLLFPIVTNPVKATGVLKWVVQEMESRYERMSHVGVRSVQEYQAAVVRGQCDDQGNSLEPMPYIVVMIDELADLMIVAGKEVETHIVRIAQMARASGIHMMVATQRPSVDVVTGLIKVNFPSRIAFRVSSKVDSRTIIDERGAEKLLGRGDMLFVNSASPHIARVHGAYIADNEIEALTRHLKRQQKPQYLNIVEALKVSDDKNQETDELYPKIVDYLQKADEISISMLQRVYRIGFNRSARIISQLEQNGLIAPAQGSKPRKVIRHD